MSLIFAFQNFTFILFSVCIYDFAIIIIESKILDFFKRDNYREISTPFVEYNIYYNSNLF